MCSPTTHYTHCLYADADTRCVGAFDFRWSTMVTNQMTCVRPLFITNKLSMCICQHTAGFVVEAPGLLCYATVISRDEMFSIRNFHYFSQCSIKMRNMYITLLSGSSNRNCSSEWQEKLSKKQCLHSIRTQSLHKILYIRLVRAAEATALRLESDDREPISRRCRQASERNGSTETALLLGECTVLENGIKVYCRRSLNGSSASCVLCWVFRLLVSLVRCCATRTSAYSTIFLLHMVWRAVLSAAFSSLHACVRTHQCVATSTWVPQYVFVCMRIGLPTSHASVAQCVAWDCAAAAVTSFVFLAVATSRNSNSLLTNWTLFFGYFLRRFAIRYG